MQIYLDALTDVGRAIPKAETVLDLIKNGITEYIQNISSKSQEEKSAPPKDPTEGINDNDIAQKIKNYERVIKELKKSVSCYKTEIDTIKKSD